MVIDLLFQHGKKCYYCNQFVCEYSLHHISLPCFVFLIEEEEVNLLRRLIYLHMNNVPVAKDTAQCNAYRLCVRPPGRPVLEK